MKNTMTVNSATRTGKYMRRVVYSLSLIISINIFSQESVVKSDTTAYLPNINPTLNITRITSKITIDGKLDEPAWENLETATNFTEVEPGNNIKPPVKTEVMSVYDDENIYFAFICYDDEMNRLRVSMADRDNAFNGDFCGVIIDTYKDEKQAIEVWSNAYGVQGDAIWSSGDENFSFDMIFYTEAKIYKDRWVVEFAVPFKSLRFPDKNLQEWKVHFWRNRPRENRVEMSWAKVARDEPSWMKQAGILKGLKNIKKGSSLEILPYVIGTKSDTLNNKSDFNSGLTNDKLKGDFGVNLKYGFTSNLTGELTYNPDFSQVESDATQIDVNSSSAIFYPEKRPFFLEGNNIFDSRVPVVYTRMINDPLFAAKVIGKIGKFDIGYISAYDERTQFIVPEYTGSYLASNDTIKNIKSFANVFRLKRSLRGEDYIGFVATDRETSEKYNHSKGYNRVISFDGSVNFWKDFYTRWQVLGYFTKELNLPELNSDPTTFGKRNQHTAAFDGESYNGIGGMFQIDRQHEFWRFGVQYFDNPPETRRDLGYVAYSDFRELNAWHNFSIYPKSGIIVRMHPRINGGVKYDYNGRMKEQWVVPNIFIQFKRLINAGGGFLAINNENYNNAELRNVHRGWMNMNINTSNKINGGAFFEIGKYIVRFANPSYVGFGFSGEAWLNLNLFNRLSINNSYNYFELAKKGGGEKLYTGYIFRSKTSFQFSKNFFLRLVTQYDSFSKEFDIDPLLSYKWNPFTIFYIGSTHRLLNFEQQNSNETKLVQTNRQFFAKFQYLFSL